MFVEKFVVVIFVILLGNFFVFSEGIVFKIDIMIVSKIISIEKIVK